MQVSQRMMAVELAAAFLGAFESPFHCDAVIQPPAEPLTPGQVCQGGLINHGVDGRGFKAPMKLVGPPGCMDFLLQCTQVLYMDTLVAICQAQPTFLTAQKCLWTGAGAAARAGEQGQPNQRRPHSRPAKPVQPCGLGHGLPGRADSALQRPGPQHQGQGARPAGGCCGLGGAAGGSFRGLLPGGLLVANSDEASLTGCLPGADKVPPWG